MQKRSDEESMSESAEDVEDINVNKEVIFA